MTEKRRLTKEEIKYKADRAEGKSAKPRKPAAAKAKRPAAKPRKPRASSKDSKRDDKGRFLPGNRFWEARSTAGPKPKFADGEALWKCCVEYFEWVEANPLWEDKLVTFQGSASHEPVAKMRAMTISGLCYFLDVTTKQWDEWRKTRPDLSDVIAMAESVIRDQKFAGAAADLLNANIISRDLGLADKSEFTGRDGGPIETKDLSARELAIAVAELVQKKADAERN